MKVRTESEKLRQLRKGVVELYVSDHPLNCKGCPADTHCELQSVAADLGVTSSPYGHRRRQPPVRACDDQQPVFPVRPVALHRLLALRARLRRSPGHVRAHDRGPRLRLARRREPGPAVPRIRVRLLRRVRRVLPHRRRSARSRSRSSGAPDRAVTTTCAYCGVGCSFEAEVKGEQVVRMVPSRDGKANRGHACVKGRFAYGYATHADRITTPMIRKQITDPWQPVSWDEAFAYAASEFRRIQAKYGRESVGGITSSRCTNEETFLVQKLVRAALGTNNVDTCARVCHSPTGYGLKQHAGRVGRHAGLRFGDAGRRDLRDRRQPDRRPPGVRVAHEAPAARGCEADRGRSARDRPGALAAHPGRLPPAAEARAPTSH